MDTNVLEKLYPLGCAVVGAVIGALIKGYFDTRGRERRELSLAITEPHRLVLFNPHITSRVELKVDGKVVKSLVNCEIKLINSGNRAITDMCLSIDIEGDSDLITAEFVTNLPRWELSSIQSTEKRVEIKLPYINPNELVHVRLLMTGIEFKTVPFFRQPDVILKSKIGTDPDMLAPALVLLYNAVKQNPLLDVLIQIIDSSYRRYVRSEKHLKYLENSGVLTSLVRTDEKSKGKDPD